VDLFPVFRVPVLHDPLLHYPVERVPVLHATVQRTPVSRVPLSHVGGNVSQVLLYSAVYRAY
jgi:hypothetical protein